MGVEAAGGREGVEGPLCPAGRLARSLPAMGSHGRREGLQPLIKSYPCPGSSCGSSNTGHMYALGTKPNQPLRDPLDQPLEKTKVAM